MQLHNLAERMHDYFRAGGEIMFPLLLVSLVMWTLALVKILRLIRERRKEASPDQCLKTYHNTQHSTDPFPAEWQCEITAQYMHERCSDPELNREMLHAIRLKQEAKAMRNISTILILANLAPLLGLLGTVTGMITTFDVISEFGTGNARALASGISEALVTTQSGLVIAVPGLILGGLLLRRAENLKARMTLFCIGLQCQTECPALHGE